MDQMQVPQSVNDKQKKSALLGWISFLLILPGSGLLGYIGFTGFKAYTSNALRSLDVGLLLKLLSFAVLFGALAFLVAVITLFIRKQKKGLAIFTVILSFVLLVIAGGARYAYFTAFESESYDSEFQEIPEEELYIDPDVQKGEINFENIPVETMPREEVEKMLELYEVDWPYLDEADLPEYVHPYMYSQSPVSPCYLKPGAEVIDNYVLFGIDDNGLSDVIMIVSMDRAHQKIKLISIQRDSYVRVPGWGGYTKINHAYGLNKETSAIATLNLNFKLNIKDYFTVHFSDVEAIVDVLGGAYVYLDNAELNYMHNSGYPDLQLGSNCLNGQQTVTYSRIRAIDSEVTRTGRQREVLNSLFSSCKSLPVSAYPGLVDTFTGLCKTSVDGQRILSMVIEAVSEGYTLENHALINYVKAWGGQIGLWYFIYDLDAAGDMLYRLIYEDLYISGYPENGENIESNY